LSALLFGALLFASAGTFTSCKDYDDDINNLQEQINTIASSLEDIKAQIGDKGVTSVTVEGGKLIVVTNGQTVSYDLPSGVDVEEIEIKDGHLYVGGVDKGAIGGTNGSIVTVNEDGVLMIDGKEAGLKVGTEVIIKDASNGVYTISINGETIQLPMASAGLVSISPLVNDINRQSDIYYGLLSEDIEWDGVKAVDGKMAAGMYPVLEKDINIMLNPTGVDGTAYSYEFRDSENETPWGLKLGEASVYAGDKLTVGDLSRTTVSPSGVWTISRYLDYVPTKDLDERADYVTQFRDNYNNAYAFALQANDKNSDTEGIKSQYLYSFNPLNVNDVTADFEYNNDLSKNYYTYGVEHTPNFEAYVYEGSIGSILNGKEIDLADVIYDYKLSIDESKMTKVKIDEYGLKISADKHAFIAEKAQAVNNKISLIIDYILINGQKGQLKVDYTIVEKDITFEEKNVTLGSNVFEAKLTDAGSQVLSVLDEKYVYAKTVDFVPEDVFGSDYNEWEDAMYALLKNAASDSDKADILKQNMDIIGGDPINVDANYNNALRNNFIYIDYVDADGKSCIYGVNSADALTKLKSIKKLRVYFIAGTYVNGTIYNDNDHAVKLPYYTQDGTASYGLGSSWENNSNGFALPLDNAFRVRVATAKNEQTVASYTFTFELTMPECPVTRVKPATETSVQWGKWTADNKEWDLLKVYGELDDNTIYGDLRDAFTNVFTKNGTAYTATKEASYYTFETAMIDASESEMLIGATTNGITVNLAQIEAVSTWANWNTKDTKFAKNAVDMLADNVVYNHFGVYPENLDKFYVQFASKIENGSREYLPVAGQEGIGSADNPLMAQPVYGINGELTNYVVNISDANFDMKDAFGYKYYLFDSVTTKDGSVVSTAKRNSLNNMWANNREGINDAANTYGLNPTAKVDGAATTTLVTFGLRTWDDNDASAVTSSGSPFATQLKITIDESVAAAKNNLVEVTLNITDVFGHTFPLTVYIQTVK
ncbi:hypothetical protein, partial [Phocaeicola barnesiae]|uniref:hypothetical protein n=1 Tax=Phocaeicola barnesiae TaxID=376804 RepID=UPI001D5F0F9E